MRKTRGLFIAVLVLLLLMELPVGAGSDFQVAYTTAVEERPAVAYNSQTNQFLVAYRIKYTDISGLPHYGVQCQLLNADGTKSGPVLYPFGDLGAIDALGRPAIAYNSYQNIFFVAVAEHAMSGGYDNVIGRFLNGDGTNLVGPDFLFNDSAKTPYFKNGSGTGSLRVVYNYVLDEFLVTVQREVSHADPIPERHNTVAAQRISASSGTSAIVEIEDSGVGSIDSHAIGCAPVAGTTPEGGRYVFVYDNGIHLYTKLLNSQLNFIADIPATWATPQWGARDPDIAYGEVEGQSRILVVWTDYNACAPGFQSCSQMQYQWTGVWGMYIDPFAASYPTNPADSSFPISHIYGHTMISSWPIQAPSVSYSTAAKGFFVAWREAPSIDPQNIEIRSHIRGTFIDYFVEYRDLSPDPPTNTVLTDVTGAICTTGAWCASDQDPEFPAVAGGSGLSAAVVWQQKYPPNPADIDVMGDIYIASPLRPDLVEISLANPPASGSPGHPLEVTDTVANQGSAAAGASTTRYYFSTDTVRSRYDVRVGNRSVPALAAGATSSGGIETVIPTDIALGTYYLLACADDLGAVTELSESNNCIASSGTIVISAVVPPGAFNKTAPANGATGQSTSPTLSWGASTGATSYEVCMDASDDNACEEWVSTGSNTSVGLSGLGAGTTYYWQVRATNAGGTTYANGFVTAHWSFTTVVSPPGAFNKAAPTNGATGQSTSPSLSWGASTGATSYAYCYDTTNDNACSGWTSAGTSTSVGLSGLGAGTTYYWHVRATNAGGTTYANGSATAYWSFTTAVAPPGAFNKAAPTNGATGQSTSPSLSWGASTGATSYAYCYDTTNDNACSGWTSAGTSTSVGLSGLGAGTTYYWHVRATNAGGTTYANGSATAYWSFTTAVQIAPFDFTGDGRSDVLWRHATAGEVWLWPMNGPARTAETHVRTVADTNWEIRGLGDLTGGGKADVLWRNKMTGQIYLWPMNGSVPLDETYVGTVDPAYDIVGTGDFDGNGKSDILWRHTTLGDVWVWLMDGATPLSEVHVDRVDPAYVVKGVGDVDADGKADIVWHHATSGAVWVWLMSGATRLSQTWVATVPDTGYQIQGVADFDGNGKSDILWWHGTYGEVWIWTMNGTTKVSETWVATVPDTSYRIVGSGDYDGDGKADILWHHATRGEVWMWLMNGATRLSQTWVATVPDTGYQIVEGK